MVEIVTESAKKNRRDHYLPQSYLRGFVDPERMNNQQPLWHFDVPSGVWSERSPREIGYRKGFYDYAATEVGLKSADNAFAELERTYPVIRRELISNKFENWMKHRDFLLRYIQMMRARSPSVFRPETCGRKESQSLDYRSSQSRLHKCQSSFSCPGAASR